MGWRGGGEGGRREGICANAQERVFCVSEGGRGCEDVGDKGMVMRGEGWFFS